VEAGEARLTLSDIHLDHAPKEGATLPLDAITLVARSISGGRTASIASHIAVSDAGRLFATRLRLRRLAAGRL
jgi:cell volume regulation protein A